MTVAGLIALELVAGVAATVAWLGSGAAAAARRAGLALALFCVAVAASLARAGTALALAPAGWWFVQEKVTLTLPLLVAAVLAASVLAAPRLVAAVRARGGSSSDAAVVVPLLGAGYAAMAGPAVTLLVGYPATWSTGLVTVALVAGAVLVTWRAVSASVPGLRVTAAVALATGLAGAGLVFVPAEATDTGGGPQAAMEPHATRAHAAMAAHSTGAHSAMGTGASSASDSGHAGSGQPVTALRGPSTPAAGGEVRRFTLTARTATITLSSGREVAAWTFDGRVPGPPITAAEGDLIEVRLRNADVTSGVTLHWHGYDVPSGEDGVPGLTQDAVMPGQEFLYRFRATQVGTYWYHTHEVSDRGVKMGLYGMLVVTPRETAKEGADLTVPVHTFAGKIALGDHDQPFEQRVAPGAPVRLRLVNTDNTPHQFTLSGTPYRVAAIDGRDLNGPGELSRTTLRLPAGGRYDLVFPMPTAGAVLRADDRAGTLRLTPDGAPPAPAASATEDTSGWPEFDPLSYGTPAATPFGAGSRFDRRFTLVLDQGLAITNGRPAYAHTVNGHAFPSIPTQLVREGDLVRVTVVNRGRETHPWHLHGHTVLVLSRDGHAPTGGPLLLDTFDVRPGEVWEVAFRANNLGMWMNHCHNLSHADQGMALHLAYEGVTTPFHGAHGG
ncbi:multicopper oxidase family protein [Sphaerisporangium sp. NBC_01403]|uniref:multicopper oxidase family protein n=1 Tax=Sphaerisporangium sp. NBC_01403 TaxID=2903599 RepID=UPI0032536E0F